VLSLVTPSVNSPKAFLAPMKAGLAYFVIVFSFAFLIGIFRVLVLAPAIGKVGAVSCELPIVLAISWVSSRLLIRWFGIVGRPAHRLAMGGLAFTLTMAAEAGLSRFVFGQTFAQYLQGFWYTAAMLGVMGQLGFALIPLVQLAPRRVRS
jgi:hypothetical protein